MKLLIRADASPEIGIGHVVRCLALAEEWQRQGGEAHLASASLPETLKVFTDAANVEPHVITSAPGTASDVTETSALADALRADWTVVDGYGFGDDFESGLQGTSGRLLAVDDFSHATHRSADIVLNQNSYANVSAYGGIGAETRLLLGSRFVLLRGQFRRWIGWRRETSELATRLLVTLGGGATRALAPNVITALAGASLPDEAEVVVLGVAGGASASALRDSLGMVPFQVKTEPHATDVTERMAWADLAISAGGSTCWELAFMGVPSCVLSLAENQRRVGDALDAAGAAVHIGSREDIGGRLATLVSTLARDPRRRSQMSAAGQTLVDGKGASRVVRTMRASEVKLRRATLSDRELLWRWRNDADVRAQSFQTDQIPWEQHVRWFEHVSADPNCLIWIATDARGEPIGQGRFVIREGEGEISVSLAPAWRGRGYGVILLEVLTERFLDERPDAKAVRAWVKKSNEASRRAFEGADYLLAGEHTVQGKLALLYTRSRDAARAPRRGIEPEGQNA